MNNLKDVLLYTNDLEKDKKGLLKVEETINKCRDILDKCFINTEYIECFNRMTFEKLEEIENPETSMGGIKETKSPYLHLYVIQRNIRDYQILQNNGMMQLTDLEKHLHELNDLLVSIIKGGANNE